MIPNSESPKRNEQLISTSLARKYLALGLSWGYEQRNADVIAAEHSSTLFGTVYATILITSLINNLTSLVSDSIARHLPFLKYSE